MNIFSITVAGVMCIILSGCGITSTDPRKGGLLGYSPSAYKARLIEREQYFASINNENDKLNEEHNQFSKIEADKQSEYDKIKKQSNILKKELIKAEQHLSILNVANSERKKKLEDLHRKHQKITSKAKKLENSSSETKLKELAKLKEELQKLEQEADALTNF